MKIIILCVLFFTLSGSLSAWAQYSGSDTIRWGRVTYINLSLGETVEYQGNEIELLELKNNYNKIRIGNDTLWLKVCYRSTASSAGNLHVFVADNKHVKAISSDKAMHGLLKKDVLLAVSPENKTLTDQYQYIFPVSFAGGYIWRNDEDSYPFSWQGGGIPKTAPEMQYPGAGLDVINGRGSEKFGILAMESGRIAWIDTKSGSSGQPTATLCLASNSNPGIFYIYRRLYSKYIFVKQNQQVERGDEIAYIWGDGLWEHLQLGIVYSDTVPSVKRWSNNMINFFPQLMDMYYGRQPSGGQFFTRGQIYFGAPTGAKGNIKNASAYESYQGTGWKLGMWNTADKVEWVSTKVTGNVRLSKTLFEGQSAQCTNPDNWYDYEMDVKNGIYRIRASVGDCFLLTWQKVEFEGVTAGTYQINPGLFTWTPERTVRVKDGRLTVRIYLGDKNQKAGISGIVFQQVD
jgi:hypothetical protein